MKALPNLKICILVILNITFLYLSIKGYNDITRKHGIMKMQKPIVVKVLDTYGGRGRSSCKVEFNKHSYSNVTLPFLDLKIGSVNNKDFYFDEEKNVVFSNNLQTRAIYFIFFFFMVSLLLWFVPKEKFQF